jgi:hypothetical protein
MGKQENQIDGSVKIIKKSIHIQKKIKKFSNYSLNTVKNNPNS